MQWIDRVRQWWTTRCAQRRAAQSERWLRETWLVAWQKRSASFAEAAGAQTVTKEHLAAARAIVAEEIDRYPRHGSPWRHHRNRLNAAANGDRHSRWALARDEIWAEAVQGLQASVAALAAAGANQQTRPAMVLTCNELRLLAGKLDRETTLRDLGFIDVGDDE